MTTNASDLFWSIMDSSCKEFSMGDTSLFWKLIESQKCSCFNEFQLPEPWNGDIEKAPILFIGPNPGYTPDELYPQGQQNHWLYKSPSAFTPRKVGNIEFCKEMVEDFFENRFETDARRHLIPNSPNIPYLKYNSSGKPSEIRMANGEFKKVNTRYWNFLANISSFELDGQPVEYGKTFALTELVRFKSEDTTSMNKGSLYAPDTEKWLYDTLHLCHKVRKIIIVGISTAEAFVSFMQGRCSCNFESFSTIQKNMAAGIFNSYYLMDANGNYLVNDSEEKIEVIFCYHSSAFGKKGGIQYFKDSRHQGKLCLPKRIGNPVNIAKAIF